MSNNFQSSDAAEFFKNFLSETKVALGSGLHGNDVLDYAINHTSNFSGLDALTSAVKVDANNGQGLADYFGIIFEDNDTGALIGSHAGGSKSYNAEDIVPEDALLTGSLSPIPSQSPVTKYFTNAQGQDVPLNIIWNTDSLILFDPDDKNDTVGTASDLSSLSADRLAAFNRIAEGLDRWWIAQACSLVDTTFGLSMENATLKVSIVDSSTDSPLGFSAATSSPDEQGIINIKVNLARYSPLDSTDHNGKSLADRTADLNSLRYLDRVIAHEMTHAAMLYHQLMDLDDNSGTNLPGHYTEGIAELVQGADDSKSQMASIIQNTFSDADSLASSLIFTPGTGSRYFYAAGYGLLRYLAKQSTDGLSVNLNVGGASSTQGEGWATSDLTIRNIHDGMYLTKTGTQNVLNDSVVGQFNVDGENFYFSPLSDDVTPDYYQSTKASDFMTNFLNETKVALGSGLHNLDVLSYAINHTSNFNDVNSLINAIKIDLLASDSLAAANNLKNNFGIINDSVDTGAVLGLHAGGSKSFDRQQIVPESGSITGSLLPEPSDSPVTLFFTDKDGNDAPVHIIWDTDHLTLLDPAKIMTVEDLTGTPLPVESLPADSLQAFNTIAEGLNRWWITEGCSLVDESFGLSLADATLKVGIAATSTDTMLPFTGITWKDSLAPNLINISFGLDWYSSIDPHDPNGSTDNTSRPQFFVDRIAAHELTHAAMYYNDLLDLDAKLNPQFPGLYTEGIAELVHGLDDSSSFSELLSFAQNSSSLDAALNLDPGTGQSQFYSAGYMLLRYLTKQSTDGLAVDLNLDSSVLGSNDSLSIKNIHDGMYLTNSGTQNNINNSEFRIPHSELNDSVIGQFSVDDVNFYFSPSKDDVTVDYYQPTKASNFMTNFLNETSIAFGSGLHSLEALDFAIKNTSNFKDTNALINAIKIDLLASDSIKAADNLKNFFGIVNDSIDTGAVLGSHSGGDKAFNRYDIVPETGSITGSLLPEPSTTPTTLYFTDKNGKEAPVHIIWNTDSLRLFDPKEFDDGKDEVGTPLPVESLPAVSLQAFNTMVEGLNRWWLTEGCSIVDESFGLSLEDATLRVGIAASATDSLLEFTGVTIKDSLDSNIINIFFNLDFCDSIDPYDPNGNTDKSRYPQFFLDRTAAHELTHAAMFYHDLMDLDDNRFMRLPGLYTEGIAELVHGIDDSPYYNLLLRFATNSDSLTSALNLKSGTGEAQFYALGYALLRYLSQQSTDGVNAELGIRNSELNEELIIRNVNDGMYLTDEGTQHVLNDSVIGSFKVNDSIVSYSAIDSLGQLVSIADNNKYNVVATDSDDTIKIGANANVTLNTKQGDDSVILSNGKTLQGSGSLVFDEGTLTSVTGSWNLDDDSLASDDMTVDYYPASTKSSAFLKKFLAALKVAIDSGLKGNAILDEAVRKTTNYTSINALIDAMVLDATANKSLDINGPVDGDVTLRLATNFGIVFDNEDVGAVVGSHANSPFDSLNRGPDVSLQAYNAVDIVPELDSLSAADLPIASSVPVKKYFLNAQGQRVPINIIWNINEVKLFNPDDKNDEGTITPLDSLSADRVAIANTLAQGLNRYWLTSAASLVEKSLGLSLENATIQVGFIDSSTDKHLNVAASTSDASLSSLGIITMNFALDAWDSLSPTDPNGAGTRDGRPASYVDRLTAHEMTHAAMFYNNLDVLDDRNGSPLGIPGHFAEGIAEFMIGADDVPVGAVGELYTLAASGPDSLLAAASLSEGTGDDKYYSAGYMMMRYLSKQSSDGIDDVEFIVGSDPDVTVRNVHDGLLVNYTGTQNVPLDGQSILGGFAISEDSVIGYAAMDTQGQWLSVNDAHNYSIYATASNDTINLLGSGSVSLDSGGGKDYVVLSNNETIVGNGQLVLTNGSVSDSTGWHNADYLVDANYYQETNASAFMKKFLAALKSALDDGKHGIDALDSACKATTNFSDIQGLIDSLILDATADVDDGEARLKNYFGVDFNSSDTGSVLGLNSGGNKIFNAEDISPENDSITGSMTPTPSTTTVKYYTNAQGGTDSLSVTWDTGSLYWLDKDGNISSSTTLADLSSSTLEAFNYLTEALDRFWITNGATLIDNAYGLSLSGSNIIVRIAKGSDFSAQTLPTKEGPITLTLDFGVFGNLASLSDPNGLQKSAGEPGDNYLDRVIAHELTHAAMYYNGLSDIFYVGNDPDSSLPGQFLEGIAELVQGNDDSVAGWHNTFLKYTSVDGALANDVALSLGSGEEKYYSAGYLMMKYLTQQSTDGIDDVEFLVGSQPDVTVRTVHDGLKVNYNGTQNVSGDSIIGEFSVSDDSIISYSAKETVGVWLSANDAHNYSITATDFNDTINVLGSGNVTVNTGLGYDIVVIGSRDEGQGASEASLEGYGQLVIDNGQVVDASNWFTSDNTIAADYYQETKASAFMTNFLKELKIALDDESLHGTDALSYAIKNTSNFKDLSALRNSIIVDATDGSNATADDLKEWLNALQPAHSRLKSYFGIDANSSDTGSVLGLNSGGSTLYNAEDISPEGNASLTGSLVPPEADPDNGIGTVTKYFTNKDGSISTFKVNFATSEIGQQVGEELGTSLKVSELSEAEKAAAAQIFEGMDRWWLTNAASIVDKGFGLSVDGMTLNVALVGSGDGSDLGWSGMTLPPAEDGSITMFLNWDYYKTMTLGDPNGAPNLEGFEVYADRVVAHEMVHAAMFYNNIMDLNDSASRFPGAFNEGIADFVVGNDDSGGGMIQGILVLAMNEADLAEALDMSQGTGEAKYYTAGYMMMKYLAAQSIMRNAEFGIRNGSDEGVTVRSIDDGMYVTDEGTQHVLNDSVIGSFNVSDDSIISYSAIDTVGQAITINDSNNYSITATDSNDTIQLGSGDVTLDTKGGLDVVVLSSGESLVGHGELVMTNGTVRESEGWTSSKNAIDTSLDAMTAGYYNRDKATEYMRAFLAATKEAIDNDIHGNDALSYALSKTSNFSDVEALVEAMVADAVAEDKLTAALKLAGNYGVIFDNEDTGADVGSHAGGETSYNAQDIVPENDTIAGTNLPTPSDTPITKFFVNAEGERVPVHIIWQTEGVVYFDAEKFKRDEQDWYDGVVGDNSTLDASLMSAFNTMVEGLDRWWVTEACTLVDTSYGLSMENATLRVGIADSPTDELLPFAGVTMGKDTVDGVISMYLNLRFPHNQIADAHDPNGQVTGQVYLDRTMAHEMVHAAMFQHDLMDNYINEKGVQVSHFPGQYTEGIAEFVIGSDDDMNSGEDDLLPLAMNEESLRSAMVLESGTGNDNFYQAGYLMMRYLTKQATDGESVNLEFRMQNAELGTSDSVSTHTIRNVHDGMYLTERGTQNVLNDSVRGQFHIINDELYYEPIGTVAADDGTIIINDLSLTTVTGDLTHILSNSGFLTENIGNDILFTNNEGRLLIKNVEEIEVSHDSATLTNRVAGASLFGGDEDNEIFNTAGDVYIDAGEGNNNVSLMIGYNRNNGESNAENITVLSGSGNDTISNFAGHNVLIRTGAGDDSIYNRHGFYSTIESGDGNDYIEQSDGHYLYADAGDGDDTINASLQPDSWSVGGYATLLGGAGNDLIIVTYGNNASIDGGAGDDTIVTDGNESTVTGGIGHNLISLPGGDNGVEPLLILNEGDDTIVGLSSVDTLCFVDGKKNKSVELGREGLRFATDINATNFEAATPLNSAFRIPNSELDTVSVYLPDKTETTSLILKYGEDEAERVALIAAGDMYAASLEVDTREYIGATAQRNSGVDFTNYSNPINIMLDVDTDSSSLIPSTSSLTPEFWNIHSIVGGDGETTIRGSATDDTLKAGKGKTTIYGSGGNDVLIGNSDTTLIADGAYTMKAASSNASVTVHSSNGELATVSGTGTWTINDETYTLNGATSLLGSEDGIEVVKLGNVLEDYLGSDVQIINDASTLQPLTKQKIAVANADTVSVSGYDARLGMSFLTNTTDDIKNLILNGDPWLIVVGDGYFRPGNQGKVMLEGTDTMSGTFVNFTQVTPENYQSLDELRPTLYAWSGQNGGVVDGEAYGTSEDAIIFGLAPSGSSTLKGGYGDDTIYAGTRDVIMLSSGNDVVSIDHQYRYDHDNKNEGEGARVMFGASVTQGEGWGTIKGFDPTSDLLEIDELSNLEVSKSGGNLRLTQDNTTLLIENVSDNLKIVSSEEEYTLTGSYLYGDGEVLTTDGEVGTTGEAIVTADPVQNISASGNDLNLTIKGKSYRLANRANEAVELNGEWVEYGETLTYDSRVTKYHATSANSELRIRNSELESAAIWLGGEDGKTYENIRDIDASGFSGRASLAGNDGDNSIVGGRGSSSLWGGSSGDDILQGGAGYNEFFYLKGNGADEVRGAKSTDLVNLMNISLSDITGVEFKGASVTVNFNDGGSLKVSSLDDVTFKLSDGTRYTTDKLNKTIRN